ncbi:hypothetical protein DVH26_10590 [Paenibacillus sp. H1-7]|nr:hypothetical protein DVH26_10590 [Paenibacillus sp. H1-7]
MWAILSISVITAVFIVIEIPSLVRKQWRRELVTFFVLLFLGAGLSIALSLRVQIPNPLDWIRVVFGPISKAIFT